VRDPVLKRQGMRASARSARNNKREEPESRAKKGGAPKKFGGKAEMKPITSLRGDWLGWMFVFHRRRESVLLNKNKMAEDDRHRR